MVRARAKVSGSIWVVLLVLFVGSALSIWGAYSQKAHIKRVANQQFEYSAQLVEQETLKRLSLIIYGLRGAKGVYAASKSVDRLEFRSYVESRDLDSEFKGALGFGFIEVVQRANLQSFIERERKDYAPEFDVKTTGNADDLYIIKFIEPLTSNLPSLGFDIGSESNRREAADRSIRTGMPSLTKKVQLVQVADKKPGFLLFLPIYQNGKSIKTEQDRIRHASGLVYAPVDIEELFEGVMSAAKGRVDVHIHEGDQPNASNLLLDADGQMFGSGTRIDDESFGGRMFQKTDVAKVSGETWTLVFTSTPEFERSIDNTSVWSFAIFGIAVSILASAAIWLLASGRTRAIELAKTMTQDLRVAKGEIEDALRESNTILGTLNYYSIVSTANSDGVITSVNDGFCSVSGYTKEELIGRNHRMLNSGVHSSEFWQDVWQTISSGKPWRGDICNRAKDGALYWVDSIITPFMDAKGEIEKYVSIRNDITERIQILDQLRTNELFMKRAGNVAGLGAWQVDLRTSEVRWSDETCFIHDLPAGHKPTLQEAILYYAPEARAAVEVAIKQAVESRCPFDFELPLITAKNRSVWVRSVGECEYEGDTPIRLVGAFQDITSKRKATEEAEEYMAKISSQIAEIDYANQQLTHQSQELLTLNEKLHLLATSDVLTGLASRGEFGEQAGLACHQCTQDGSQFAVLFLDLDNFKFVNDSLGHEAGDQLLQQVSQRICANVRNPDLVARLGGDEFAVLLRTRASVEVVDMIASRIVEAMQAPYELSGMQVTATCSVGVAVGAQGMTMEEVTRNADTAMYHAKHAGKSAWKRFELWMLDEAKDRLAMEADLRQAWEDRKFQMVYQPMIDLGTGQIYGAEALIRWNHPEKGWIPPNEFIALAEEIKLIVPLGRWILEESCRTLKEWQDRQSIERLNMSVNVSVHQLQKEEFLLELNEIIAESGILASQLTIEITETVMVKEYEKITPVLHAIRELGVRVAIDDFGTGYSSMGALSKLPANKVKIDQSFVAMIGDDLGPTAILRALITLCRTLGLKVVAEGIENESQLVQLQSLGCDLGQGYLFSRPLSKADFSQYLENSLSKLAA